MAATAIAGWIASSVAAEAPAPACKSTVTGDVRMHELTSRVFQNTRKLRVLVPPGYDAPENAGRRYPVLYMLDGQNLYDACLSPWSHTEWGVDETVYRLIREKAIPSLIVVGIDSDGTDRAHEYLPYRDFGSDGLLPPAGSHFPDFVTLEVMPLIDSSYRTLRGHDNTGIGGSSYGGVAALYTLMAKPEDFGYGLIESASLHIGMGQLLRDTAPFVARPRKVYIGVGGHEGGRPESSEFFVGLSRKLESNLRAAGYNDSNVRLVVDPDAQHSEIAWAKRLPGALTFLFGDLREPAEPSPPTK
jgi:predicted alpha/beta superfamily hydrolase